MEPGTPPHTHLPEASGELERRPDSSCCPPGERGSSLPAPSPRRSWASKSGVLAPEAAAAMSRPGQGVMMSVNGLGFPPQNVARVVVWEWLNEHSRWRPYTATVCHHIENVLKEDARGSVVLGQVDAQLVPYIIDLQSMHQFRQDTGEWTRYPPPGQAETQTPPPSLPQCHLSPGGCWNPPAPLRREPGTAGRPVC